MRRNFLLYKYITTVEENNNLTLKRTFDPMSYFSSEEDKTVKLVKHV